MSNTGAVGKAAVVGGIPIEARASFSIGFMKETSIAAQNYNAHGIISNK